MVSVIDTAVLRIDT